MQQSMTADPAPSAMAGVSVRTLAGHDRGRWDAFVQQWPDATFFHLSGWQEVIERAAGHRTYYLYAERDGAIAGVLPLAHVKSLLFGNALISTPFCVYGGAVGRPEARAALEQAACELAERLSVDYLELRNLAPSEVERPKKDLYVTFRKAIDPDQEKNLLAIPRKQRAMVRKGIDAGLTSVIDEGVDRLHDIYAQSVRNLGTPVFSKRYFAALCETFGPACEVLTVLHGAEPVSSVMSFYFRDQVLPYYGGGTRAARAVAGNDFLYWELMRRAAERGVRLFDYGRSKVGTGAYGFKKNWGFVPEPLHYEYHLVKATAVPDVNPLNPKYRLFIEAWKRMPLAVTKLAGPWLARNLG